MTIDPAKIQGNRLKHPNRYVRFWAGINLGDRIKDNMGYHQLLAKARGLIDFRILSLWSGWQLPGQYAGDKTSLMGGSQTAGANKLKNQDEWVRLYAALVLDELGKYSRSVMDDLNGVMDDENKYVVRVANHALNHL